MQTKVKVGARGAALGEYVLLIGLIGVVAIASVSSLGGKVQTTLEVVTGSLSAAQEDPAQPELTTNPAPDEGEELPEEVPPPPGPTFTWKGDGTDILKPGITPTSKGWIIDINTLVEPGVNLASLRYDAWISLEGSFIKRWPQYGDSTSSYSIHANAFWILDGGGLASLVGDADSGSPSGDLRAYKATTYRLPVPKSAIGIQLERTFICNMGSICKNGEFNFDISFY